MSRRSLHAWNVSPQAAIKIQEELRAAIALESLDVNAVRYVAGADVSFDKHSDQIYAAVVVLAVPSMDVVARSGVTDRATFPYIPGLLSFREAPAVLKAWDQLNHKVDALLLDGQGMAHPRRFGLACHIGLWLDIPAIGCAKSVLVGSHEDPPPDAGTTTPLIDRGDVVGVALRTKDRTNPMFVSPGHRVDVESAVELVMRCVKGYRQPEPTRQAHLYVNKLRRGETEEEATGWLF